MDTSTAQERNVTVNVKSSDVMMASVSTTPKSVMDVWSAQMAVMSSTAQVSRRRVSIKIP